MEARAISKHNRQSARKMRLVIDTIRGKSVGEAYAILQFSKKKAAEQIDKTLRRREVEGGCGGGVRGCGRALRQGMLYQ
jgi:ribosomal protein L22